MPLYNKQAYVKRAIDSVLNQRFTDFELIIIDDGSTDGSVGEVPANENRIKLIRQKNAGPSVARNRGMETASGRFITFIDADDYYYDSKLEHNARLLHDHPDVDWLISAFDLKINNDSYVRNFKDTAGNPINGAPVVINNALLDLDISGIHINGLCVKKDLICNVLRGFRETIHCFEITDLLIRCALVRPRVIVEPEPAYSVVDVPNSAFKASENRTRGARHMGQLFHILTSDLNRSMQLYQQKGMGMCFAYVRGLIHLNRKVEARQYLLYSFPFKRNWQWLKYYMLCLIPNWSLPGG